MCIGSPSDLEVANVQTKEQPAAAAAGATYDYQEPCDTDHPRQAQGAAGQRRKMAGGSATLAAAAAEQLPALQGLSISGQLLTCLSHHEKI